MGKRDREESPKGKSPLKTADAGNSKGSKEASKAKHFYIVVVAKGAPPGKPPLQENHEEEDHCDVCHTQEGCRYLDKYPLPAYVWIARLVEGRIGPQQNSPSVITTIVMRFDVSRILINRSVSCYIMYSKLFEKMGPERSNV